MAEFSPTKKTIEQWRELANKQLNRSNRTLDDLVTKTAEGIDLNPLYTAEDTEDLEFKDSLPGFEPFIRGPQATMYAGRPWTIRQYAGFSTAEESNAFYRKALASGAQGGIFEFLPYSVCLKPILNVQVPRNPLS